jgi:tetratricopeptide (TPR) repeat protein
MSDVPSKVLSLDEIESIARSVIKEAQAGAAETAWLTLQPLRKAQRHQDEAAEALLQIVDERCLPRERGLEILSGIAQCYPQDVAVLSALGQCLEAVRDIDDLNAPPAADPLFRMIVDRLAAFAKDYDGLPEEEAILRGLGTAARMLARQCDDLAEHSYRKLTEINPGNPSHHYNIGLLFKTRGRFEEGMKANQVAASLSDAANEAYEWNLGICATGAGHGAVALDVWKRMGQIIEMGRFGLPEGSYPSCKVRLAERPLAERTADADDPGLEETVWIERLSPCHGIIRSVLYGNLGVDYGDVILMDGAPITWHRYGDQQIPVHPHLATLVRQSYQFYAFAGTQSEGGQLLAAREDLAEDSIIYPHSEAVRTLCASCWRNPDIDHDKHESMEKHVVIGRIAAPGHMTPVELLDQIDKAMAKRQGCRVYAPDLCVAAGLGDRARIDRRRYDLLAGN